MTGMDQAKDLPSSVYVLLQFELPDKELFLITRRNNT